MCLRRGDTHPHARARGSMAGQDEMDVLHKLGDAKFGRTNTNRAASHTTHHTQAQRHSRGGSVRGSGGRGVGVARGTAQGSHRENERYMREFYSALESMGGGEMEAHRGGVATERGAPRRSGGVARSTSTQLVDLSVPRACTVGEHPGMIGGGGRGSGVSVVERFRNGPSDVQGTLVGLSDRNLLCLSISPVLQVQQRGGARGSRKRGREVAVGCADHGVYTFELKTGTPLRQLYSKTHGHTDWVAAVVHTCNGQVVSGGADGRVCAWNMSGRPVCDYVGSGVWLCVFVRVTCASTCALTSEGAVALRLHFTCADAVGWVVTVGSGRPRGTRVHAPERCERPCGHEWRVRRLGECVPHRWRQRECAYFHRQRHAHERGWTGAESCGSWGAGDGNDLRALGWGLARPGPVPGLRKRKCEFRGANWTSRWRDQHV